MDNEEIKIIRKITNALNANDTESARKIIERDLKRIGKKDNYYFYLALISENPEEKLILYTNAINANGNFLDAYINRGLIKNELKDYEGSLKDYDKAIELDKNCALAYNNRGYTKYKMQDYKGALNDYNKAILLNPKLKIAIDNKASMLMQVCMEDDSDFTEKYYISLGIRNVNGGDFNEAIANFNEALKYNQQSDLAYFYMGVAQQSCGFNEEAVKSYSKCIRINKKMTDAYFNRGQILMQNDPKQALDDFVSAIALDSKFIDAYYSVAAIQKKLGQYEDALKNLNKILEIEPMAVNAKALKKLILTKYMK